MKAADMAQPLDPTDPNLFGDTTLLASIDTTSSVLDNEVLPIILVATAFVFLFFQIRGWIRSARVPGNRTGFEE